MSHCNLISYIVKYPGTFEVIPRRGSPEVIDFTYVLKMLDY